jgi:hypothetical protein
MKVTSLYSVRIERYRNTRFWAVWRGEELIAVTVYKKGAHSVAAIIGELSATRSNLNQKEAA